MHYYLRQIQVYLSYISFKKIISALSGQVSYTIASTIKKPFVQGQPISITIEPANLCNLDCPECPAAKSLDFRKRGVMEMPLYKNIIDDVAPYTWHLMLYFQGEPLLHKEFAAMVAYAVARKIYTVTSTNAQTLDNAKAKALVKSGLHEIIVSMDGTTQATYEKYRKQGELSKVKAGIKALILWKKYLRTAYPLIHLQFLVFRHNEHQLQAMKHFARIHRVDKLTFKSAQINNPANQQLLTPANTKFNRYQAGGSKTKNVIQAKNRCKRLWTTAVITYDGTLVPCCFDKHALYPMGSLREKKITALWKSEALQSFRHKVLTKKEKIPMCRNCTQGLKVKW